jgi:hypothetical protein
LHRCGLTRIENQDLPTRSHRFKRRASGDALRCNGDRGHVLVDEASVSCPNGSRKSPTDLTTWWSSICCSRRHRGWRPSHLAVATDHLGARPRGGMWRPSTAAAADPDGLCGSPGSRARTRRNPGERSACRSPAGAVVAVGRRGRDALRPEFTPSSPPGGAVGTLAYRSSGPNLLPVVVQ